MEPIRYRLMAVDHQFITDLDLYMRTQQRLKHNAIIKNKQQLRRVITVCCEGSK